MHVLRSMPTDAMIYGHSLSSGCGRFLGWCAVWTTSSVGIDGPLPSAEESELVMVASCGGRCVEGTSTAKTVRMRCER